MARRRVRVEPRFVITATGGGAYQILDTHQGDRVVEVIQPTYDKLRNAFQPEYQKAVDRADALEQAAQSKETAAPRSVMGRIAR